MNLKDYLEEQMSDKSEMYDKMIMRDRESITNLTKQLTSAKTPEAKVSIQSKIANKQSHIKYIASLKSRLGKI